MQLNEDKLKVENAKLCNAYREKSRKHQQTQELYDRLKRKEMTAATQSAAFDSVDEVLQSVSSTHATNGLAQSEQYHGEHSPLKQFSAGHGVGDHQESYYRDGSDGNIANGRMMPPPLQRSAHGFGNQAFGQCKLMHSMHRFILTRYLKAEIAATPFGHRTRLGSGISLRQQVPESARNSGVYVPATSHSQTPFQRRSLVNMNSNSISRPSVSGYGMSAGMKVGRQQGMIISLAESKSATLEVLPT